MIFVVVGNRYGFDRLLRGVDELVGEGVIAPTVIAQTGESEYRPRHCEFARYFEGATFDRHVRDADALIGHAGSGTIASALAQTKPLLVMPRRAAFGEHVNDHQVATARRFGELGSVLVAEEVTDLRGQVALLQEFVPFRREPNVDGLVARIGAFLRA